ncbi:MAG: hypothetical protein JW719_02310 [Pirellulales bacterium]|nr:hypothetical protein [Pirellulales bacterium]
MRATIALMLSTVLLAALAAGVRSTAANERKAPGPILLELNAPLLSQPIDDEPAEEDVEPAPDSAKPREDRAAKTEEAEEEAQNEEKLPADDNEDRETIIEQDDASSEAKEQSVDADAKRNESTSSPSTPDAKPADEPQPLPELSEEMKALRAAVRRTIASYYAQPLNTRDNTPTNVLAACMAFGCEAQVLRDSPSGQKINALACLCCNYPCAGRGLLRIADGRVLPEIGYGLQQYPAEFLAALALSRVPADYELHVGKEVRKVSDLVAREQRNCRSGEEGSLRLIGMARYLPTDAQWQNELGEDWSISRMIKEELERPNGSGPAGGTFRLLALAYAVDRRDKRGEPMDGQFERAKAYLDEFSKYALDLQNPDGSWHPEYFAYRGQGGSMVDQVNSTGHILRWLAFSLPHDQLRDPCIVRGANFLANGLDPRRYRGYLFATSAREIDARLTAVHALMVYNERLFVPYDEAEKAKAEREKAEKAKETVAANPAERS